MLKGVGHSTMRGKIFSEVRGTYLHAAVFPLIDIATLVNEQRKNKDKETPQTILKAT